MSFVEQDDVMAQLEDVLSDAFARVGVEMPTPQDLRADRQPEFTQVDIEMSFVEQDDVMAQLEDVLSDAFARVCVEMPTPLRRLSYWDAMDTYGSDKPDTRYGMELVDLTDVFVNSAF